jgi:hypothetical protein
MLSPRKRPNKRNREASSDRLAPMMTLVQRQSGTSPFGALIQRAHGLSHFKNLSILATIRT